MKFKPGDLVWAACSRPECDMVGELPGVVVGVFGPIDYKIEVEGHPSPYAPGTWWAAPEFALRPRRPPEEPSSWERCGWVPEDLRKAKTPETEDV